MRDAPAGPQSAGVQKRRPRKWEIPIQAGGGIANAATGTVLLNWSALEAAPRSTASLPMMLMTAQPRNFTITG
jgi:hypothetical protein